MQDDNPQEMFYRCIAAYGRPFAEDGFWFSVRDSYGREETETVSEAELRDIITRLQGDADEVDLPQIVITAAREHRLKLAEYLELVLSSLDEARKRAGQ
jgi:hypothetical protein